MPLIFPRIITEHDPPSLEPRERTGDRVAMFEKGDFNLSFGEGVPQFFP